MNAPYAATFVFATMPEAEPLLARNTVNELQRRPLPLFESARRDGGRFLVLISGMGPEAASTAIDFLADGYAPGFVINCGVAGSLTGENHIGEILRISTTADVSRIDAQAIDAAELEFITLPPSGVEQLPGSLHEAVLLTRSIPVFDLAERAALARFGDLIDMEGAALAAACARHALPCALLKVVSDHASDREHLLRNLTHTSRRLAGFISYYLDRFLRLDESYESERSRIAS